MGNRESKKVVEASIFALAALISGCATHEVSVVRLSPPAEAMVQCREVTKPDVKTANDLALWASYVLDDYSECAARHRALSKWAAEYGSTTAP